MSTITTRTVQLSVIAPTLDDVIREVVEPTSISGRTITFALPADVQAGDTLLVISSARCMARMLGDLGGDGSSGGNAGWYGEFSVYGLEDDFWNSTPEEFPPAAVALGVLSRQAVEGDAGTTIDIKWKPNDWPAWADESTYNLSHFKLLARLIVLKGEHWTDGYAWYSVKTPYDEFSSGEGVTNSQGYQFVLYMQTLYETGDTFPPTLGVTEIINLSSGGNHLYIGVKIVPNTGLITWDGYSQDNATAMANYILPTP